MAPNSAGWDAWIFGAAPGASIQNAFGSSFVKQIVGAPASWTPADFNFDRDFESLEAKTAETFNATSPDLSRFAARGGKLILYHGWSDAAIPAQGTIDYRDSVVRHMGAKRAGEFVRLFMVPGMHHCAGGTGPSDFGQNAVPARSDSSTNSVMVALQEWVERGSAPEQLVARQQSRRRDWSAPIRSARPSRRGGPVARGELQLPRTLSSRSTSRPSPSRLCRRWR